MNLFKSLDTLFPCGNDRSFGEVVSCSITISVGGVVKDAINWKRKAWYVNASVNAFHLHRGLVKEFRELSKVHDIPSYTTALTKRLIALSVLNSYLSNRVEGGQYHHYAIDVKPQGFLEFPSCYWTHCDGNEKALEVIDRHEMKLIEQIDFYVMENRVKLGLIDRAFPIGKADCTMFSDKISVAMWNMLTNNSDVDKG